MALTPSRLVLASQSSARAALLRDAGLKFTVDVAGIDEAAVRHDLRNQKVEVVAGTLADGKAIEVSRRNDDALVIGADQILECDGVNFDKPRHTAQARDHLSALRGREHRLVSAVSVAQNGTILWRHVDIARLTMRDFSKNFLDDYLADQGDSILDGVGAYKLERLGVQLFSRIEGDYFTILGLPLLPLLAYLRSQGVVER